MKCSYCDEMIDLIAGEEYVRENGEYFHIDCLEEYAAESAQRREDERLDDPRRGQADRSIW